MGGRTERWGWTISDAEQVSWSIIHQAAYNGCFLRGGVGPSLPQQYIRLCICCEFLPAESKESGLNRESPERQVKGSKGVAESSPEWRQPPFLLASDAPARGFIRAV